MAKKIDKEQEGRQKADPDSMSPVSRRALLMGTAGILTASAVGAELIPAQATTTTIRPHLVVHDAAAAVEWYRTVFGAKVVEPALIDPTTSKIAHIVLEFFNSRVVFTDEFPEWGELSPRTVGGTPAHLHVAMVDEDIDGIFQAALAAGAKVVYPLEDQFYGARAGRFEDPWGHQLTVCLQKEITSGAELQARFERYMAEQRQQR